MPQTPNQRAAADKVAAWLANNELPNAWLAEVTGADVGTIGDFLGYKRWPKTGTQGRIEKALGWPPGAIRQMGYGQPIEVSMTRVSPAEEREVALRELREVVSDMQERLRRLEEGA